MLHRLRLELLLKLSTRARLAKQVILRGSLLTISCQKCSIFLLHASVIIIIIIIYYYYYYYYLILFYNGRPFSELRLIFKGPLLN
jgi:hypothetical protein